MMEHGVEDLAALWVSRCAASSEGWFCCAAQPQGLAGDGRVLFREKIVEMGEGQHQRPVFVGRKRGGGAVDSPMVSVAKKRETRVRSSCDRWHHKAHVRGIFRPAGGHQGQPPGEAEPHDPTLGVLSPRAQQGGGVPMKSTDCGRYTVVRQIGEFRGHDFNPAPPAPGKGVQPGALQCQCMDSVQQYHPPGFERRSVE